MLHTHFIFTSLAIGKELHKVPCGWKDKHLMRLPNFNIEVQRLFIFFLYVFLRDRPSARG